MRYDILYRVLYALVHNLFTFFEWILGALEAIGYLFVEFCHEFLGAQRSKYLKNEIEKRNKIPKHLTVLLGNEEPSYKDLANIVVWCLNNRIPFLSYYDHRGALKKHQDKLEKAVSISVPVKDHVIWHSNTESVYKNGFVGRKIHIKILSEENGKRTIANLAQDLSRKSEGSAFSIQSVDEALQKDYEFPEPDLGLYCGKYLCFMGYPPWQLRVTEFLSIKSHHRLKYRTFLEQLYIFGKCEQRLGK